MDTSKTYIAMCDCAEIRQAWNLKAGDFFTRSQSDGLTYCLEQSELSYIRGSQKSWIGEKIWLPRQDQLQEMVIDKFRDPEWEKEYNDLNETLLFKCNDFVNSSYVACSGYSMEQLWLAFVMKEKFNKTWNGSEWIS